MSDRDRSATRHMAGRPLGRGLEEIPIMNGMMSGGMMWGMGLLGLLGVLLIVLAIAALVKYIFFK